MADGYFVGINWNNDGNESGGDFTDVGEDVTADVLARGPVTFQYGRDQARALSPPRVGSLGFTLCNAEGLYSPGNPASPIGADVGPASRIKVAETIEGIEYPLMRGRVDTLSVSTSRRDRTVQITGFDDLALLRGKKITTGLHASLRTGQLMAVLLDAAGAFTNAPRRIDVGATFVPWWWANNDDAFDMMVDLIRAEGPPAVAYVDPDGGFVFRDRHHRLLNPQSLVPQAMFSDAPTVELFDSFTRTVSAGWGTADTGQSWSVLQGPAADVSVDGAEGRHTHPVLNVFHATVIPWLLADVDVQTDVSVNVVPSGDGVDVHLMARVASSNNFYSVRLFISSVGALQYTLRKRVAGVESALDTFVPGITYVADTVYRMRLVVEGQNIMAKIWAASDPEPFEWHLTATDSDLSLPDDVGVRTIARPGLTNPLPVVFSFDNFQAMSLVFTPPAECP